MSEITTAMLLYFDWYMFLTAVFFLQLAHCKGDEEIDNRDVVMGFIIGPFFVAVFFTFAAVCLSFPKIKDALNDYRKMLLARKSARSKANPEVKL